MKVKFNIDESLQEEKAEFWLNYKRVEFKTGFSLVL